MLETFDIFVSLGPVSAVCGNIFSSVALILINKKIIVVDHFRFMALLTGLHFYFSFLSLCLMLFVGLFRYKSVNNYSKIFFITVGSLGSIIFMNLNLANNSVGFYQVSKLSCIPITLMIESVLGTRQQKLTLRMCISLILIIFGMVLVAVHEISFNSVGLIWAALGVLSTSCAQIFFGPMQKDLGMNALQLLFHTSPFLTCGSFAVVPLFENLKELWAFRVTNACVVDVLVSCVMAVMLNATNYIVLGWASPLTYQIIGHFKTILILLLGAAFFDQWPGYKAVIGVITALFGVIIYSEENRQQQMARSTLPVVSSVQNLVDETDRKTKECN